MRSLFFAVGLLMIGTAPALPPGFYDRPLFGGLSGPTSVAFAPDGRVYSAQKTGAIRVFRNGQLLITPFMNVACTSNSERGVLGLALDPSFATNHYIYVYYTTSASSLNPPATPKNRVSRFVANGDTVVPGSEEILVDLIPSDAGNHNAGCIRFGIDGKLWITTGDGGQTPAQSQDLNILAGKLLRVNPDGSIPSDNPFVGQSGRRPEIWAYGFRNPFRFNFRSGTSVPYVGDVGAVTWEEIDVASIGGNFGWPNAEGMNANPNYINPIYTYPHNGNSRSVTGGIFGASPRYPSAYAGRYIYADYVQDTLFYLDVTPTNALIANGEFGHADGPVDFVMGPGESIYYVAIGLGQIRKLTYEPRPVSVTLPASVFGGNGGTGTVTLDVIAPTQGLSVALGSNSPALTVPASVPIAPDEKQSTFGFSTSSVANDLTATVTATAFTKSATGSILVRKNELKAVFLPATVLGTKQGRGYVALQAPAGQATTVNLSSSNPAAIVPSTVVIPAGALSAGFWLEGADVEVATQATISAELDGITRQRTLMIVPTDLVSLSVSPNPIHGGDSGTGTVTLRSAAETGGATVALADKTSLIATPGSVSVSEGSVSGEFSFSTLDVTVDASRTMSATYRGVTRTVTVTLTR